MRLRLLPAVAVLLVAAGGTLCFGGAILSESGALPSFTGAPAIATKPAEWDCTLCHAPLEGSNLNTPGGAIELLGVPALYSAGTLYRLRVRLASDSTAAFPARNWGFQLTAVRTSDGEGSGTFVLDDSDTLAIVSGADGWYPELSSRRYVGHTLLGGRDSLAGPVEWTFSWRAPSPGEGAIHFYAAGNAANGDQDPGGDFIFTTSAATADTTTPTRQVSWGSLKRRYR